MWIGDSGGDMKALLLPAPISCKVVVQVTESKTFIDRNIWKRIEGLKLLRNERLWVGNKLIFCIVFIEDQIVLNILIETEPIRMRYWFCLGALGDALTWREKNNNWLDSGWEGNEDPSEHFVCVSLWVSAKGKEYQ